MPTKPKGAGKTQRLDTTPSGPVLVKATVVKKREEIAKARMGRPKVFSQELADRICYEVMAGSNLHKICQQDGMPSRDTIYTWLVEHTDFSDNYARACKIRREDKFERLEAIADTEEDVARARLKVDVIKWQLSKEEPRKYGDKLDIDSKTEIKHSFGELTDEQLDKLIAERQNTIS